MSEGEDTGCCCPCLNPTQRKFGYYATYGLGLLLFLFGILNIFSTIFDSENSSSPIYLICGSALIILDPLWIKNCNGLMTDLKSPGRITSTIIFIASNAALIVFVIIKVTILIVVSAVCVVCAGIWYFLSFFPGAQDTCLGCLKGCCPKAEGKSGEASGEASGGNSGETSGETV